MKDIRHKQKLILNNVKYANLKNHDWQWKLSTHDPREQNVQPMALLHLVTYWSLRKIWAFALKYLTFFLDAGSQICIPIKPLFIKVIIFDEVMGWKQMTGEPKTT